MKGEWAPGRPANLTPEQEASLREMWKQLAILLNWEGASKLAPPANTPLAQAPTQISMEEKKKSKGRGFFGRRRTEKETSDTDSTTSATAPTLAANGYGAALMNVGDGSNDKFGETKAFKEALAGQSPEELRQTLWMMSKHDNPDALMLRFLRARKWNVQAALVMMISAMRWRMTEIHVDDDVMFNGEGAAVRDAAEHPDPAQRKEAADFISQVRSGKGYMHGVDAEGRPMCFVRVRLHRLGEQTEASLERHTVHAIEHGRLMMTGTVDTATIVFDMTGFSLANMDYAPVKFMIKCFEANYPESLGAIIVHKAPWVFQGIWAIIRGWLDPVVAGKVHFTKSLDDLLPFVPKENIPKEMGGDEDFEYHYIEPQPDENKMMEDTAARDEIVDERKRIVKDYEAVTTEWLLHDRTKESEKPVLEDIKTRRQNLTEQLRANYWRLDPYVRARSYLDRERVIRPGGVFIPYPDRERNGTAHSTVVNGTVDAKGLNGVTNGVTTHVTSN
jgi:hypothetical protein